MHIELQHEDYAALVRDGHYAPRDEMVASRLDHVRRVWENQLTRFYLRPALQRLVQRTGKGLRVLDMGCGNGEGWQLLTRIPAELDEARSVLPPEQIAQYLGVDLCPDMVCQARARLHEFPQASFAQADLSEPDDFLVPADLYYSSYGSPSHLDDDQLARLVESIARKAPSGALVVLDLLGQFSLEWPCYWGYSSVAGADKMQPYNMVWLYPNEEREARRTNFTGYRLRFWGGHEVERFLRKVLGPRLRRLARFDRSIFVGRHLDTGDFNPRARPTRSAVNSLFEFNRLTRPGALRIGPLPEGSQPFLTDYRTTWNGLVSLFELLCRRDTPGSALDAVCRCLALPPELHKGVELLARQVINRDWLEPGAPIGNNLEPALGLLLRQTEYHLQQGLGCGHGLVVVAELA